MGDQQIGNGPSVAGNTVKASQVLPGERGEILLARGEQLQLRKWEGEPVGEVAPEHANPYEYVAYLIEGAIRIRIGAAEPVELVAGDSYAVPANTSYGFEILKRATVIEAMTIAEGTPRP